MEHYIVLYFPIVILVIWSIFTRGKYKSDTYDLPFYIKLFYDFPFWIVFWLALVIPAYFIISNTNALIYCFIFTIISILNMIIMRKSIKLYNQNFIRRSIILTAINFSTVILLLFILHFILFKK